MFVSLKDISFTYHKGSAILENVSFTLKKGEITTLIGPNGAGKSTLLKIILGILNPTSGTLRKTAQRPAYIPQNLNISPFLPLTVLDFLELTRSPGIAIQEALKWTEATDLQSKRLSELSGGQKQRILLAKALCRAPDLLVMDEPTTGLDLYYENLFYTIFKRCQERFGTTILFSSHDLHMVFRESKEVLCLDKTLCCVGTPDTLQNDPNYKKLFKSHHQCTLTPYVHTHTHTEEDQL
jgi:zinc transport system ATP-binding protein